MKKRYVFLVLIPAVILFLFLDFDGVVCRDKQDRILTISYDPVFGSASVGASPTYRANVSFVKKIFVSQEGFLAVLSQGVMVNRKREERISIKKYHRDEGFTQWLNVPPDEVPRIQGLDYVFDGAPHSRLQNCGLNPFSNLLSLWQIIRTV